MKRLVLVFAAGYVIGGAVVYRNLRAEQREAQEKEKLEDLSSGEFGDLLEKTVLKGLDEIGLDPRMVWEFSNFAKRLGRSL